MVLLLQKNHNYCESSLLLCSEGKDATFNTFLSCYFRPMPLYTQDYVIGLRPRQNLQLMPVGYIDISPFFPMHEHLFFENVNIF